MVMSFCIIIRKEAMKPLKPPSSPPPHQSLVPFVMCGLGGTHFPKVRFRGGMELYSHQISSKGQARGEAGGGGGGKLSIGPMLIRVMVVMYSSLLPQMKV